MPEPLLTVRDLEAWYGESHILHGVDLEVRTGEVVTLLGRNGAGKTTTLKSVMGIVERRRGSVRFGAAELIRLPSNLIARLGLVRSFQISAVFPHLTVLENVRLALQRARGHSFDFWRSERVLGELNGRALELLDAVGLAQLAGAIAVELPYGRKRALEIATTLAMDPKLMLLDEPTQGMGLEDVDRIRQLIKKVSADRTILMVEHNMSVVSSIADTITVLQRGALLAEGPYAEVSRNPQVIEAYMGTAQTELAGAH